MIDPPREIDLYHVPTDTNYLARIVRLTSALVRRGMGQAWWDDPAVTLDPLHPPVDRRWPWEQMIGRYDTGEFASTTYCVAIVMGKWEVQGAMVVDAAPRPCTTAPRLHTIHIEAIATAPRNRPELRTDKQPWLRGVGLHLLEWAIDLSRDVGCAGRLTLDASPGALAWYRNRGFAEVPLGKKNYGGVEYTPMDLSHDAAERFKQMMSQGRD